jgi:hypothetical protein
VRIRPNFGPGGVNQGTFGTAQTIFIGGSVLESTEVLQQPITTEWRQSDLEPTILIYPNPMHGNQFVLHATDLNEKNVALRVFDNLGRIVFEQSYVAEYELQTIVTLPHSLPMGLYTVQILDGHRSESLQLMVE